MSLYDLQQSLLKGNILNKQTRTDLLAAMQRLALWESNNIEGIIPAMPKYLDRKMQSEWAEIQSFAKRLDVMSVSFKNYGWNKLSFLLIICSKSLLKIRNAMYASLGTKDQKTLDRISRNLIVCTHGRDEARHDGDRIDDKFAVVELEKLYKLAYWACVSCSDKCNGLKENCEMLEIMREMRIPAATGYERCPYWSDEQGAISDLGIKLAVAVREAG